MFPFRPGRKAEHVIQRQFAYVIRVFLLKPVQNPELTYEHSAIIADRLCIILKNFPQKIKVTPMKFLRYKQELWGHAVAHLVEALLYNKPEGRVFDSRWCHWNFSLT
jgi:hypothetical protein